MSGVTGAQDALMGGRGPEEPREEVVPDQLPTEARDGALAALAIVARLHHVAADVPSLRHSLGLGATDTPSMRDLLLAAKRLGLKAKPSRTTIDRLTLAALPALATLRDGRTVVLAQCDGKRVLFMDPSGDEASARPTIEPIETFAAEWTGELILVTRRASLAGELAKFDFSWFIPSIVKHRRLLGEVLTISLFLFAILVIWAPRYPELGLSLAAWSVLLVTLVTALVLRFRLPDLLPNWLFAVALVLWAVVVALDILGTATPSAWIPLTAAAAVGPALLLCVPVRPARDVVIASVVLGVVLAAVLLVRSLGHLQMLGPGVATECLQVADQHVAQIVEPNFDVIAQVEQRVDIQIGILLRVSHRVPLKSRVGQIEQ